MSQSSRQKLLMVGAVLAIYLTGCMDTSSPTPTPLPDAIHSPNPSAPALTPSPRPVIIRSSTATASSPTPTRMPTPTPLPALITKEEALAFVIKMQESNGSCELPCWWGITPGKTIGQEARQVLSPLRNFGENYVLDVANPVKHVYTFHLKAYSDIDVRLETSKSETQPVETIGVSSLIPDSDQSTQYHESWQRYYLKDLFTKLGMPTEVWLGFGWHVGDGGPDRPPESSPYFWGLYVYYDELGLKVEYAGLAIKNNPNRACFSFSQLKTANIFIQRRPISGPPLEPLFGEVHPIQDVSNLSLEEFYMTVKDSKSPVCIESPAKYWP